MSQSSNKYQKFEDDHWQELAEKFIKKHEAEWIDFVDDAYQQAQADREPPDYIIEDDDKQNREPLDYDEPNPEDR